MLRKRCLKAENGNLSENQRITRSRTALCGGSLSTRGVVPACRSLDCVSIFALDAADAGAALDAARGFDPDDAYSRPAEPAGAPLGAGFRFGLPRADQLEFFGNPETPRLFEAAAARLARCGGAPVEIDFAPFLEAARLLYEGPWVAERYAAIRSFIETRPEAILPVTYRIISSARRFSAVDAFEGTYQLRALRRQCDAAWRDMDVLLTPTAGTVYTLAEVAADPIRCNADLGYYTNFMNLLDLAAVAVPTGFQSNGLPFGVTLAGPAFADSRLLELADRLQSTH
jgi:allophanate hydrolase